MVIDLVVPGREQSLMECYEEWKADAEENACCDFAFRWIFLGCITIARINSLLSI